MEHVTHFKAKSEALCGQQSWYSLSNDYRDVTCKRCEKLLKEGRGPRATPAEGDLPK